MNFLAIYDWSRLELNTMLTENYNRMVTVGKLLDCGAVPH